MNLWANLLLSAVTSAVVSLVVNWLWIRWEKRHDPDLKDDE